MAEQITTHFEDAKRRLLQQYREKPNIEKIIKIYTKQIQELEDKAATMIQDRQLEFAVGTQLDFIGAIVGFTRPPGMSDEDYRTRLYVQIGINTSEGDIERAISIFKLIVGTEYVHLVDHERGGIDFEIPTEALTEAQILDAMILMERVIAGGCRVEEVRCHNGSNVFGFAGINDDPPFKGFSDPGGDPEDGGEFTTPFRVVKDFAFSNPDGADDPNTRGFSDPSRLDRKGDPLAGGAFIE